MDQKVILISGASSGIGKATATRLHKAGHIVYAAARRLERMEDLKQQGMHVITLDLTDDDSMQRVIGMIIAKEGRIDVLVNNAGYGSYGSLEEVPLAEGKRQFDVNLFGLARLTQLVVPTMREHRTGRIINVSSIGGKMHEPLGSWYHASKFAVEGLSDCLRVELAPFGIDVVVIEPGLIDTEWPDIAAENLLNTSGHGPYSNQAKKQAAFFRQSASGKGLKWSDPDVVARGIEKAVKAKRPKTRYAMGCLARLTLWTRRLVSDRTMDWIMTKIMG